MKSGGAVVDYKTQTGLPNAFQNRVETKLFIVFRNELKLNVCLIGCTKQRQKLCSNYR